MTQTTYEMIKALPGKGTNWPRLVDALHTHYVEVTIQAQGRASWEDPEKPAPKGIRELRDTAMLYAGSAVDAQSRKSSFIPASQETLDYGGCLGGNPVVWTDKEASESAEAAVAKIIQSAK